MARLGDSSWRTAPGPGDHENPSNPPYTILEGASSTETEPLAIINELADQLGAEVVCQQSFTMVNEGGIATFVGTLIAIP